MKRLPPTLLVICLLFTCTCLAWPLNMQERPLTREVTLYFPVSGTNYLGSEKRVIQYSPALPFETALVSALLQGPESVSPFLEKPFQPGLKVLATSQSKGLLFITFNDKIYKPYAGEAAKTNEQKIPRRKLAMDALANTITENTDFSKVQVLVDNQQSIDISMRLNGSYLFMSENDILPPFTRNEFSILTPSAACKRLLTAWQEKREEISYEHLVSSGMQSFSGLPLLLSYEVYEGTITANPSKGIVCVSLTIQNEKHQAIEINRFPLRVVFQNGFWVVEGNSLNLLLQEVFYENP